MHREEKTLVIFDSCDITYNSDRLGRVIINWLRDAIESSAFINSLDKWSTQAEEWDILWRRNGVQIDSYSCDVYLLDDRGSVPGIFQI